MDQTVGQHIKNLEERLRHLNLEFMDETNTARRNRLESEIRAVELALSHFRTALELERSLSQR